MQPVLPSPQTNRAVLSRINFTMLIVITIAVLALIFNLLLFAAIRHHPLLLGLYLASDGLIILLLVVSISLISKRARQLASAARESQERYRRLRDGGDEAILRCALAPNGMLGAFREVNAVAVRRTGYTEEELRTLTPADLFAPKHPAELQHLADDLHARNQSLLETVLVTKSGSRFPIEVFARLVEDQHGAEAYFYLRDISEAKRTEEALGEERTAVQAVIKASPLAIVSLDVDGKVTRWNAAAEAMFGWQEYELFGRTLPIVTETGRWAYHALCAQVMQQDAITTGLPARYQRRTGELLDVEVCAAPLLNYDGQVTGLMLLIADVTQRKREEIAFQNNSRALLLVSEIKKAMFRALEEQELLEGVCQTLVGAGGHGLAWIGFVVDEGRRTMQPAAWASSDPSQTFATRDIRYGELLTRHDPIATALRTGNPDIVRDLTLSAPEATWMADALNQGFGSLLVVPLSSGYRALGALVICAKQLDAFPEVEIELLVEIADDLAYGIEAQRTRAERQRAQEALLDSARQWRSTFDAVTDLICVVDVDGNITRCNRAVAHYFGKLFDEIIGRSLVDLLHGSMAPVESNLLKQATASGQVVSEIIAQGDRWFKVTVNPLVDDEGHYRGAIHVMEDITEFKIVEQQAKQNYQRLQNIFNDSILAILKIAEIRDPYTSGHELRVSQLACAIAQEMALPDERIDGLRVAGRLHDIGKLSVPAEMLGKTRNLSEIEFNVIKAHPQTGFEILSTIDFPWPVAKMVFQHHERLDGTGYPNGLLADDILLEARILAVADVVESMTSHRPYRPARGQKLALEEIEMGAGTAFDADVVEACLRLFQEKRFAFEKQ